jgi:phage terminase small subunit
VVNPQSGRLATHPAVYIAAAAWRDVVKFGAPLGLDPSSEINLSTPPADDDITGYNPFDSNCAVPP